MFILIIKDLSEIFTLSEVKDLISNYLKFTSEVFQNNTIRTKISVDVDLNSSNYRTPVLRKKKSVQNPTINESLVSHVDLAHLSFQIQPSPL